MQDFQSMLPGAIFSAADHRRLRGYPLATAAAQPPIKCPRCDSTNTKFCYYNNYNLSQPRHFCKSCRRYWTRGGVLRNVPVGGGSRKSSSKRSSSSFSKKPSPSPSASVADKDLRRPPASRSSSDTSSLTAADAPLFPNPNPNPSSTRDLAQETIQGPGDGGSFTSLMASAAAMGFGYPTDLTAGDIRVPYPTAGMADLGPRTGGGEMNGLDWPAPVFDLSGAVDQGVHWNQSNWGDPDPSLYLP